MPKDKYRQQYYEALDLVVVAIKRQLDHPSFRLYQNLVDLLLFCVCGKPWEVAFEAVTTFYKDDIDPVQLRLHLDILHSTYPQGTGNLTIRDTQRYLKSLSVAARQSVSQVVVVLELVLTRPSTNAISEQSFSALRRLKTYFRTTMKQSRLNHILLLHIHEELTDSLSLVSIADAFVGLNEHRMPIFGKFSCCS